MATTRNPRYEGLYQQARDSAVDAAGGPRAFRIIGSTLAAGLVTGEGLRILCSRQGDDARGADFAYGFATYVIDRVDDEIEAETI